MLGMVRDLSRGDRVPGLSVVLGALRDEDCQELVRALEEPKTAGELSEECGIPLSTTYRKLETLVEATLLMEETEIDPSGHHTTRYRVAFEEVRVMLSEEQSLDCEIRRPALTRDERLVQLWSEVQRETER